MHAKEWIFSQIYHFNFFVVGFIIIYDMLTANKRLQTQLKEQSQELYNEIEELKDEIRMVKK